MCQIEFRNPGEEAGPRSAPQTERQSTQVCEVTHPFDIPIVVPFFNEQENIPTLYMKITEVMDSIGEPYEMVFVDDGSKDNSYRVLLDIYEHDRRVNVVCLRRNFGQTPALKAGFDFARGEIVISMDGDLQHDPEEIPRFLEKIEEGYDLVSGWRYQRRDHWLMRRVPEPRGELADGQAVRD